MQKEALKNWIFNPIHQSNTSIPGQEQGDLSALSMRFGQT
jgi:hypothetical protein